MVPKTLGLDLGSNSVGGAIREESEPEQFKKVSVITFKTGVEKDDKGKYTISLAANRTQKRSIRRLYQARKYKLWATLELLAKDKKYCPIKEESLERWKHYSKEEAQKGNGGRRYPVEDVAFANWIKLDFNNDGVPDYKSPYQLREELATQKLDFSSEENRFKLGRAIYHSAQHRGFKSSKKVQNKEDETVDAKESSEELIGAERPKEEKFNKEIEKLGAAFNITVGATLASIERAGIRIRKDLHQYVTRKMLIREIQYIFDFQGLDFESIFKEKNIGHSAIFWQRPLRSQKGTIGKCTLETNKFRCPASRPEFEEFRALSFINNICYKDKNDSNAEWQQLPLNLRKDLLNEKFFVQKDFEFYGIYKWLQKKNGHDNWELNYNFKINVPACTVSARLQSIFDDKWNSIVVRKAQKINEYKSPFYEDIWHVLFESDDEDFIRGYADTVLKLDPERTKKFVSLWFAMPVAYGNLSLKAINNVLPFLRQGLIYTEAVLLAKVPDLLGKETWGNHKDSIIGNLRKDVIENNRDEKRLLNIANNLIAQYKALPFEERYAENDFGYKLKNDDLKQVEEACREAFGIKTWNEKDEAAKVKIRTRVEEEYQSFFSDKEREFKKLPRLLDSMKQYLSERFDFLRCTNPINENERCNKCIACKRINKLYHPSQIDIYPPAKIDDNKNTVLLGSPKTGAFKNPMALRALYELRKYINYLIETRQVDETTRIVIEVGRELVDTNKRWAYETYQNRRKEENKEFALAILELLNDPEAKGSLADVNSDSDIDKFRLWYEMIDDVEWYERKNKLAENVKITKTKKNRKGEEEDYEEFEEKEFERINKSLYFKLKKAKDNIVEKYKLWKEQEYRCLYTGNIIKITDLFKENVIDFEHTLPRSMSFDNSLANRTVCYADYNRNVKKNQIPANLPNYEESAGGYPGIKSRLKKWEQKVDDLKLQVEFWKGQSKKANDIERKNHCIRQKHLWQFELDYWENKVSRFTMKEITSGFKNSQLKDTQIISKYALHYLKTYFHNVTVQKGAVTAEFRKIFGIQEVGTVKDRSKHSHHAKDAIVLSLIPPPALREQILKTWYEIQEQELLLKSDTEKDKNAIRQQIEWLKGELERLKKQCQLPNVNAVIDKVDEQLLINNIARDKALIPAKKRIRSRGKVVPMKDKQGNIIHQKDAAGNKIQRRDKNGNPVWKIDQFGKLQLDEKGNKIPVYLPIEKWAKGDAIRGQLHKDSFLGAIKLVKKNKGGKWLKNDEGSFDFDNIKYVIREELVYKKNSQSPGFKDLKDLEKQIIDKDLFEIIKKQVEAVGDFKEALKQGIWMLDKKNNPVNKIRRVRVEVRTKNAIPIKEQTYKASTPSKILPDRKHKETYWAENKERPYYAMYENNGKLIPNTFSLKNIAERKSQSLTEVKKLDDIFEHQKNDGSKISFTLTKGQKIIFLKDKVENVKKTPEYVHAALYKILGFEEDGRIKFQHHLSAKDADSLKEEMQNRNLPEQGASVIDFGNPIPILRLRIYMTENGKQVYNYAVEGKHFDVKPDGEIKWRG